MRLRTLSRHGSSAGVAPLPESTYQAVLTTFGEQDLAEVVYLVGCFSVVGVTLNAFDASVPGREELIDYTRRGGPL